MYQTTTITYIILFSKGALVFIMKLSLRLKYLILGVALLSIIITFVSSITSVNKMNKKTLIENTLETNRVYAQKLANSTDVFFDMTFQTLQYSANILAPYMEQENNYAFLLEEADRLKLQSNTLNSIVIAKADGEVLATSPQSLDLVGKVLNSEGGVEALNKRAPMISKPYTGISGRLIIFISQPIFNSKGDYLGLVGGSIYLLEENYLNELLGSHFYQDGSYVFVVDDDGRIIYHEDQNRIDDVVDKNPVVADLMTGKSGAMAVTNSKNVEMLAGYAYIESSGWGIVSQRPIEMAIEPNAEMIKDMILNALPFLVISILLVIFISRIIAMPLQQLAYLVEVSTKKNQHDKLGLVKVWYYEAIQLKRALTNSMSFFHNKVDSITAESNRDHLTGLFNRRSMEKMINELLIKNEPFVLIISDIDNFKRVNDTYGHAIGDEVLIYLASMMTEVVNAQGLCYRFGGEEFVILLPKYTIEDGFILAEQLRNSVSSNVSPSGERITISSGVAAYNVDADNAIDMFNTADSRLYEAKKKGRNQTNIGKHVIKVTV